MNPRYGETFVGITCLCCSQSWLGGLEWRSRELGPVNVKRLVGGLQVVVC